MYGSRNAVPCTCYVYSGPCGPKLEFTIEGGVQVENEMEGLALVDPEGTVIEFISYGGSFTAVGGPADGMASVDIGQTETSASADDESLQRGNGETGSTGADFTWSAANDNTPDAANINQTFALPAVFMCDGSGGCIDACTDGVKNQDETDTDCGGVCGATCADGDTCVVDGDCSNDDCNGGTCALP